MALELPEDTGVLLDYWIIRFPFYGIIVFYGNLKDAQSLFDHRAELEGPGIMRRADPENEQDRAIVSKEILAVRADKEAGIKGLPYLPGKGWIK